MPTTKNNKLTKTNKHTRKTKKLTKTNKHARKTPKNNKSQKGETRFYLDINQLNRGLNTIQVLNREKCNKHLLV
jgi:hypothetical protein